ncbi:MAG: hypothetical protein JW963_17710 [Anaerolineales bacterium]|nr:hypothetical protein [Anaerolineales bacterium]
MKRILIAFAILTLLLTACGPEPEPTMSPADVQGTAMAAAMTMVAETQAAIPTATSIPPTEAPTATPFPINTVPPLSIASPTQSIATQPVNILPTNTTAASVGASDPCNQPLTAWDGESARLRIVNNTKPKGHVVIALGFTTELGQCGIISASFDSNTTVNVPVGTFWASAFVDGKQDFKVFGGDTITRPGNYSLWVENERIILKAGCAPNC